MKRYFTVIGLLSLVLVVSSFAVKPSDKPIEQTSNAPKVNHTNQIKVVADTTDDGSVKEEIVFMTPEGKVFKKLKRGICPDQGAGTILSADGQYALNSEIISYTSMGEGNQPLGDITYKMIYYNAKGETQFEKVYKVYLEGYHDWDTKAVSDDGNRIMIYYVSKRSKEDTAYIKEFDGNEHIHHVEILDRNGEIVCSKIVPP